MDEATNTNRLLPGPSKMEDRVKDSGTTGPKVLPHDEGSPRSKVYFIRKYGNNPEVSSAVFVDFYDDSLARINTIVGQIYVKRKFLSFDPNDLYEMIESKSSEYNEYYSQLPNCNFSLMSSISEISESGAATSTHRMVNLKNFSIKRKMSSSSENGVEKPLDRQERSKPRRKRPRAIASTASSLGPLSSRSPSPTWSAILKTVTKKAQKADGAIDLLKAIASDLSASDAEQDTKKLLESVQCSVEEFLKLYSSNSGSPASSE